ncbi:hypothetical protein [Thalassovita sp.]|uniref:hypothetical protein n=1 Tax=Thalassovita sp. TaxID=1979401 RepID=UPI0029DE8E35|nr:hypothetical protein [Thalassovita sp.]
MVTTQDTARTRAIMALIGAAGGGAIWWLFEALPEVVESERTQMFVMVAVLGFFLQVMALSGPVRLPRVFAPAAVFGVVLAGLAVWASFRFDGAKEMGNAGHPFAAMFIIAVVGTPFLSVTQELGGRHWNDYPALFQTAWSIVVRFAAAGLFAGVFWGVLLLSDALLDLVGIDVIEDALDYDPVPYVIHGIVLGLALAVAHEWRRHVAPHLLLRLLRLLVPLVVPVLALFLIAVALNGLAALPDQLSDGGLLVAVAVGGITLVTVAVDRDGDEQVQARLLVWGARALAVMLLPLAALAVWSVARQVTESGWIPDRVMLAVCVGVILLYGLAYAAATLWPGDWGARVRRVNTVLAVLTLALAALWLTPVLNAERIAARSQVARILAGKVDGDFSMLWNLVHEWGKPGKSAVAQLRASGDFPQRDRMLELLVRAETTESRYRFERGELVDNDPARLGSIVPLRPEGTALPEGAFIGLSDWLIEGIQEGCANKFPEGWPGCVYVETGFFPDLPHKQGVVLIRKSGDRVEAHAVVLRGGVLTDSVLLQDIRSGENPGLDDAALRGILQGDYQIVPKQVNVLELGGRLLFPDN